MIAINARFLTQPITGVQRYAVELSLWLKRMMVDDVVLLSPHGIVQKDTASFLDVRVIGSHSGHLWEQVDLPIYLKKYGSPLLLNLCNTAPLCYANKVVTVHDVAYEVFPQAFSKSFLYAYKFFIPLILKNSRHIITVSEFSKGEICKYYDTEQAKISIIPNAVNEHFFFVEDNALKSQKYFLAVSSLNYRKNFTAVLEAFELFVQKNKDISLYIVGDMKSSAFAYIDISKHLGNQRIKFLGRVSDEELIRYYSNAVGFIYPSLYEGFGIPPLEAQKCGCPVLCSDIPVLHEVCGDSVLYCNPYDIEDMASKMSILSTMSKDLRMKGYMNAERFNWTSSAEKLLRILRIIEKK